MRTGRDPQWDGTAAGRTDAPAAATRSPRALEAELVARRFWVRRRWIGFVPGRRARPLGRRPRRLLPWRNARWHRRRRRRIGALRRRCRSRRLRCDTFFATTAASTLATPVPAARSGAAPNFTAGLVLAPALAALRCRPRFPADPRRPRRRPRFSRRSAPQPLRRRSARPRRARGRPRFRAGPRCLRGRPRFRADPRRLRCRPRFRADPRRPRRRSRFSAGPRRTRFGADPHRPRRRRRLRGDVRRLRRSVAPPARCRRRAPRRAPTPCRSPHPAAPHRRAPRRRSPRRTDERRRRRSCTPPRPAARCRCARRPARRQSAVALRQTGGRGWLSSGPARRRPWPARRAPRRQGRRCPSAPAAEDRSPYWR